MQKDIIKYYIETSIGILKNPDSVPRSSIRSIYFLRHYKEIDECLSSLEEALSKTQNASVKRSLEEVLGRKSHSNIFKSIQKRLEMMDFTEPLLMIKRYQCQ